MFGGGPRHILSREVSKPQHVGATLSRLARYFLPYWPIFIGIIIMIVIGTWTQVRAPELTGQVVDCYLTPAIAGRFTAEQSQATGAAGLDISKMASQMGKQTNCWYASLPAGASNADYIAGLGKLVLVIVGLFVLGALLSGGQFYLMTWTGQSVLKKLRVEVFKHLHRLSLNFYAENEAGNVMSRITNDMETLQMVFNFALVSITSGALLLVWVAVKMLTLNVGYALISMSAVPLMIVATILISTRARRAFRRTRVEIGKVNADLQESISGVREVQAFNREDVNIEAFRQSNAANRDANIAAVAITATLSPTLEALGYLALAMVTVTGGLVMLRGTNLFGSTVSLGLIIMFIAYVQRFNQPIQQISVLWTNIQSAVAGAERIFTILDTQPDVVDMPGAMELPPIRGEVTFEGVGAAYLKDQPVLCDISFRAKPGQTIAIVGPTGAGKTTIINLIPRFYDVTAGRICIDGVDIKSVTRTSLRRQIGIVLQDTFLFNDTVMNNIRLGAPDASDEQVMAAARMTQADAFIRRLPEEYQTILGEHGSGLSQGQRQLVSIARAALIDPRILILDEATSSVDTRTERQIQAALDTLMQGRTSFVIAHRLSTIHNADLVLVVEDGRIVERGTHAELLAANGAYASLYYRQFIEVEQEKTRESSLAG